jgi:DNA-binding NarL/FixJ family response regulator
MDLSIVLADDHGIVRQGLRAILATAPNLRVTSEAASGPEALRLVERFRPSILLLDLMLPGLSGLEVTREVKHSCPDTRVIILSMHADVAYVAEALRAGAVGYVLKDEGTRELFKAIEDAAAGRQYLSPSISTAALRSYQKRLESGADDTYQALTLREREVLQLTGEGQTAAQVAEQLFISVRTVESHRANAMRKLGLRNQKELVRYAAQRGQLTK